MRHPKRRKEDARRPAPPRNPCRALVKTDAAAILEPLRQVHAAVQKKLSQTEAAIERYEREDKPAFAKWVAAEFGALLTQTRQIREEADSLIAILSEWENEMFENRLGEMEAFHRVKLRQAGLLPDPLEPEPDTQDAPPEDEEDDDPWDENLRFVDAFAKVFEEMTGRPPSGFKEFRERIRRARQPATEPPRKIPAEARRLYREIVRRLHPDRNGEMSPLARDLWEAAREAHSAGDANALSTILARLDAMEHGVEKIEAPSLLAEIVQSLRRRLVQLSRLQNSLRGDLAWRFSQLKDRARARIHGRLESRFKRDFAEASAVAARARQDMNRLETAYAKWLAARGRPRRKPKPVPPGQADLPL